MTKADLVKIIANETGIIRKDVSVIVDSFFNTTKDCLKEGNHIEIRGFGTFKLKQRKARTGRNPRTDATIPVPERTVPTFKFSREFKTDIIETFKK